MEASNVAGDIVKKKKKEVEVSNAAGDTVKKKWKYLTLLETLWRRSGSV